MRTVTYRLVDLIHATINIGFVGENEHTRIIFDCKKAFEEYPSAVPSLSVTPPSGESYPAVVVRDGDYVYWDIMDSDVAMKGSGEGQLTFVVDSIVKKSYIFLTRIDRSIVPTGDAPSAIADWLVRANTALGAIPQTIADALAEAKASGEFDGEDGVGIDRITLNADYTLTIYLTNGSSYTTESIRGAKGDPGDPGEPGDDGISPTITVTDITGGHRLTITDKAGTRTVDVMDGEPGDPGEPGDDGVSPTVTITNITGGHRVKITDKTGDHTFDVMDGAKGDPGDPTDLIDDTAGTGDTDKTFSADKLTSMNSSVLNAINQKADIPEGTKAPGKVYGLDENNDPAWVEQSGGSAEVKQLLNGWSTVNRETGYINSSGGVTSNPSFYHTDYIPVSEGDVISYCLYGYASEVYIVTGYDSSKAKVNGANVVGQSSFKYGIYTVPSGVAFVRISSGNVNESQLFFRSDDVYGTVKQSVGDAIDAINNVLSDAVVHKKLNGWDSVSWITGYINSSGTVTANGSFRSTDFIPVSVGDVISYKLTGYSTSVWIVTAYDSSMARVANDSVVGSSSTITGTYTVPSGVAYVRISSGNINTSSFSSETIIGTVNANTQEYVDQADAVIHERIDGVEESLDALNGVESIKKYYTMSPNLLDPSKSTVYTTGYLVSAYMPVTAGERYTFRADDGSIYQRQWYDASKTNISNETLNSRGGESVAPENAAYARLIYQSSVTKIMFAQGVCGDFVAYGSFVPISELPDYIERDTNNLNNPHKYVKDTYITTVGGVGIWSTSRSSDFIPVEVGGKYYCTGEGDSYCNITGAAAYDSSYEFVEYIETISSSSAYTVPDGVAFIRVSYTDPGTINGGIEYKDVCIRKDQTGVTGIQKFNPYDTFRLVNAKPTTYEQNNGLYGKMWNAMGDSITEGSGTTESYMRFIAERTGIRVRNYGMSNTAIARRGSSYDNDISIRYVNMDDDADIITVFGGTNDHGNNIPIGTWGDSTVDTLYGAMKILCEGLINKYMGKKIGFITPLPKYNTSNNTDYSYPSESFMPYIECIKDVCKRYSIPVLDLYTESGIAPALSTVRTAMIPDGLHPNVVGHELISWQIQRFLERL